MAKAKSVVAIRAASKKTIKKVSTKKTSKVVEKDVAPKTMGTPKGSLVVNFYEEGFDVNIENCTTHGIMRALEEIATRYLMPAMVK